MNKICRTINNFLSNSLFLALFTVFVSFLLGMNLYKYVFATFLASVLFTLKTKSVPKFKEIVTFSGIFSTVSLLSVLFIVFIGTLNSLYKSPDITYIACVHSFIWAFYAFFISAAVFTLASYLMVMAANLFSNKENIHKENFLRKFYNHPEYVFFAILFLVILIKIFA